MGDSGVVDDEIGRLAVGHPVHPGDCLQEVGFRDPAVQVHHLLDRRVEASQQHSPHDQERDWLLTFSRIVGERLAAPIDDRFPQPRQPARRGP
jgi:hypothetical protein